MGEACGVHATLPAPLWTGPQETKAQPKVFQPRCLHPLLPLVHHLVVPFLLLRLPRLSSSTVSSSSCSSSTVSSSSCSSSGGGGRGRRDGEDGAHRGVG